MMREYKHTIKHVYQNEHGGQTRVRWLQPEGAVDDQVLLLPLKRT